MKRLLILAIALSLALVPAAASAQTPEDDGDFILRVGGNVVVAEGETIGSVVVIDGNATIAGTVTETVFVIDGDADVTGTIQGDVTVISGTINLRAGSSVDNVTSIRGDLFRADTATVTGEVNERDNFEFFSGVVAVFSFLFWIAMTIAVVVAGLVFAAVGGKQLTAAARLTTGEAVSTLIGALFVWIALPVAAGIAIATLIGLPLGLGVFIFLMPALWFLGYIVAGARLGMAIASASGRQAGDHPYLAVTLGLVIFQVAILVPVIGGLIAFLAGLWGAGALAVVAYRGARGPGLSAPPAQAGGGEPQPA